MSLNCFNPIVVVATLKLEGRKKMNREFLKELGIEGETIEKIMVEHGKTVQDVNTKLSAAETEANGLKEQLTQRDTDIESLKKTSGTNEELKNQLEELESKYKTDTEALNTKMVETQRDHAIEIALKDSKAKNITAAKALLDVSKIQITDSGIQGLDDQLKTIREENSFMFDGETVPPKDPAPNIVNTDNPIPPSGEELSPFEAKMAKYN